MKNIFSFIAITLFSTLAAQNAGILITASNGQTGTYFFPVQIQSTQIKHLTSPASVLKLITNSSGTFEYNNEKVRDATAHYIGEDYGGGIVFYIYDSGQHGLIVSTSDQAVNVHWSKNSPYTITLATADGIGAGKSNTLIIISHNGFNSGIAFAAKVCNSYSILYRDGVTYGDWYLPSKYELNLLYLQKKAIKGLNTSASSYWSSTERDQFSAWFQNFGSGLQHYNSKPDMYHRARAIRAF